MKRLWRRFCTWMGPVPYTRRIVERGAGIYRPDRRKRRYR